MSGGALRIHGHNRLENNAVAGIFIASGVGTFNNQIWWNDIVDNGIGIEAEDPGAGNYFHAECNWWKDDLGPYDPTRPEEGGPPDYNNNTAGEPVSDFFWYRDPPENRIKGWLDKSMTDPTAQCTGGI